MKTKNDSRNRILIKFIGSLAFALVLFNLNSAFAMLSPVYAERTLKLDSSACIVEAVIHQDLGENQLMEDDEDDLHSSAIISLLTHCFSDNTFRIKQQNLISVSRLVLFEICDLPPPYSKIQFLHSF